MPRSGQVSTAQILSEWGDSRDAFDGPDAFAALAGIAPVTQASGKHRAVSYRWACDTCFRQALVTCADNSRRENSWAADVYQRARAGAWTTRTPSASWPELGSV
ncbi:transposase [Streptomyces sp. NPDC059680]|uniref:transposase n=1 Tax=Streptomyces sp. NPDC059680 TaxID=3346904 RepID=UPI0036A111AB